MCVRFKSIMKEKKGWLLFAILVILVCVLLVVLWPAHDEKMPVQEKDVDLTEEETPAADEDYYVEKFSMGDLDGDGTEDYVLIENGAFGETVITGRLSVFVNDETVYRLDHEQRMVNVNSRDYLDLDGDGEKELFISYGTSVNSMPLMEWFVLKETPEGWKLLEMYHENDQWTDNGFPITVTLAKKDFELVIQCEGLEKEIIFDATKHYEKQKEEDAEYGLHTYALFMSEEYHQIGRVVGEVLPWGIWNIEAGTYEGRNCLIAEHGLGGPDGKYDSYGNAYVYFDFDEEGKIQLLDLTFKEEIE